MGTSIPCQDSTRERLVELRGDDFRSWDEFLHELADAYEIGDERDQRGIETVVESVQTVEERTGRIERQLEDLQR